MELHLKPVHGDALDASSTMYPARLEVLTKATSVGSSTSSVYGYVLKGNARIKTPGFEIAGAAGTFFCAPGVVSLELDGTIVTIERYGFRAIATAGMIESKGRLAYINGCSDSVLVMPPRMGDPVLNHLHFPASIDQTQHRHPSVRLGVVARGSGIAHGPGWEHPLEEGTVFLLHAHEQHSFRTPSSPMDVIAFHPDSDWGPTDAAHPMLNRTYLTQR